MGKILMLMLLPTAGYLWWRYLKGQPPAVQRKRMAYGIASGLLVVLVFVSLRGGSFGGAAAGGVGLAVLRYLPSLLGKYVAYRARRYVQGSTSGTTSPTATAPGRMTRAEAFDVLGLNEGADKSQIMERYKALMKNNHPDRGGSSYLATRINQAKDTLLKSQS